MGRRGDRDVIAFDNKKNDAIHSFFPVNFSARNTFSCMSDNRLKLRQVHTKVSHSVGCNYKWVTVDQSVP